MDRWKYFSIIHGEHLFWNPLSEAKVDELIGLLRLPSGGSVLDVACGAGEFLVRVVERWGVRGTGVDLSPPCVEAARHRVAGRGLSRVIEIVESDGAAFDAEPESFDLTVCLGASWIWGGHAPTLAALARWTKPGGLVLAGEPYWRKDPSPQYLEMAHLRRESFATHARNAEMGTAAGLRFLHSIVSSQDDWDRYEGLHSLSAERWALQNPADPDLAELLERTRPYPEAYLRWGREELGWATYLFMKP